MITNYCEFCHEDSEGYTRALDKNGHAYLYYSSITHNQELVISLGGMIRSIPINNCPMCGRKLIN